MLERFDFLFSYWALFWYFLYKIQIVSYNPKWILIFSLLANLILLFIMMYYLYSYIIYFIIAMMLMKVLPLYDIWNHPYKIKDIYASIIIFIIYLVWLWINQVDLFKIFYKQLNNIIMNKPIGPGLYFLFGNK